MASAALAEPRKPSLSPVDFPFTAPRQRPTDEAAYKGFLAQRLAATQRYNAELAKFHRDRATWRKAKGETDAQVASSLALAEKHEAAAANAHVGRSCCATCLAAGSSWHVCRKEGKGGRRHACAEDAPPPFALRSTISFKPVGKSAMTGVIVEWSDESRSAKVQVGLNNNSLDHRLRLLGAQRSAFNAWCVRSRAFVGRRVLS